MNERLMFGSRLSNYNLHNNKGDLSIVQDCNFTGFWIASLKSLKLIQLSLTTLFSMFFFSVLYLLDIFRRGWHMLKRRVS